MVDSLELHGLKEIDDFFRNEPEDCVLNGIISKVSINSHLK